MPLREGLVARLGSKRAYLTPEDLTLEDAYENGIRTPLPELHVGVDVARLRDRLARQLGVDEDTLLARGSVRRFRADAITETAYPRREPVDEAHLRHAAREAAAFLLRHQRPDGRFVYVYDGRTGRPRPAGYNLPRHAGAAYFLALAGNRDAMPEALAGALRALRWIMRSRIARCGGPDRLCVVSSPGRADVGSAALTAVAAADYLKGADDPDVRRLLTGLAAFLRAQQRPDGELMHEYDIVRQRPIDVQYIYYSGEAAFALIEAGQALGDRHDIEAARRVMKHLTHGWSFLGSRYYYGEDHWTCIAGGAGWHEMKDEAALDFCLRWAAWNRHIQYGPGETPWRVSGAYGVGPLVVPRLTPVASRTEAFVQTWLMAHAAHRDTTALRAQIERGLGALLRWRWSPGPTWLFANPLGARGGIPGSAIDMSVRDDYTQHAGSAMVRWAEVLRHEREAKGL